MYAYYFCFVFQATRGGGPGWKCLLIPRRVWKRYCKIAWIHEVSWTDRSIHAGDCYMIFASLAFNSSHIGVRISGNLTLSSANFCFNSGKVLSRDLILLRSGLVLITPTYPIGRNRTKNQSNPIELQSFDWVWQSNKIEHLFCCEFDFRTNRTNRTKSK